MAEAIVHCHFYQPPRENPWRDAVEAEPSAAPFHDWNSRITHECYTPFAAARLLDDSGRESRRLNLYEWASFDVGTTLARWLERNAPETYQAILSADRASASRLAGHGNAIAAPYNHVILPLASPRDRATEIRWGIDDFRKRFGREPEGFWLPETAADELTLVALADAGIRFTILAPHQAENAIDDGLPLRFSAGGNRSIALFLYDGTLAHDAAFGRVLEDGRELARRLAGHEGDGAGGGQSVRSRPRSIALDGETFGHHRRFAEMAFARAVSDLQAEKICIGNFASTLAHQPPIQEAVLVDPSSWSCPHGIERWRSNCSCGSPGVSHAWRRPLRAALNWLARELDERFAERAAPWGDAWQTRDAYGAVAAAPDEVRESFMTQLVGAASAKEAVAVFDGVRARLGMFGSCAWFFDDVAGHETTLMLRLAAFAIDKIAHGDAALEREFLERLAMAKGDALGVDAATVYRARVRPLRDGATP